MRLLETVWRTRMLFGGGAGAASGAKTEEEDGGGRRLVAQSLMTYRYPMAIGLQVLRLSAGSEDRKRLTSAVLNSATLAGFFVGAFCTHLCLFSVISPVGPTFPFSFFEKVLASLTPSRSKVPTQSLRRTNCQTRRTKKLRKPVESWCVRTC